MAKRITGLPKFVQDGYAIYKQKYEINKRTGETLLDENRKPIPYYGDFDFIGVKETAPKWAKEEYEDWLKRPK